MAIETQADVERIMLVRDISFVFQPVVEQRDGGWVARYPAADWHATGDTAGQARARLREQELQRMGTPAATEWKIAAVRQHVEDGPIPGVYELDNAAAGRAIDAGTTEAMNAALASAAVKRR
jgi:hypothetical protein